MYATFVLVPLAQTVRFSFYDWNGVSAGTWVGLGNYAEIVRDPALLGTVTNSAQLLVFFCVMPVTGGIIAASVIHRASTGRFGSVARSVIFLPQIIPLVAAGIIWSWLLARPGLINELLTAVGLEGVTRAWLGDFTFALPAVGIIGVWVLLGFCTVLLLTGMAKVNPEMYEAARIDGANWYTELRHITIPSIRAEIGVCVTVTAIAALAAFDIVYVSTGGGPGRSTAVPGIQIYIEAFLRRRVGVASALAVVLILLVLVVIVPVQRIVREEDA
ncbi:MAG TPA: sugar ABC transporter permease [Patescibacteria group bacterium]|nr:sugar ABC transporter permease [Patescibacteria group bacterium]